MSFLSFVAGQVMRSRFPLVGQQFSQPGLGMAADACEDIAQVSEGIETQPLRGGDQAGQHGGGPATIVTAIERPIATTDSDAAEAALGAVVVCVLKRCTAFPGENPGRPALVPAGST